MKTIICIISIMVYLFLTQAKIRKKQDEDIPQESHNIIQGDIDDLKVELYIGEGDYSLSGARSEDSLAADSGKYSAFDSMASNGHENTGKYRSKNLSRNKNAVEVWDNFLKEIGNRNNDNQQSRYHRNFSNKSYPKNSTEKFNYLLRVSEYYYDVNDSTEFYDTVELKHTKVGLLQSFTSLLPFKSSINCTVLDPEGIGIDAIRCLVTEFFRNKRGLEDLAKGLWKITFIWLIVYLIIAIPLWCTSGWGSCLCCKFFKPQQTIQEAKNYLLLNPPGVLVSKRGEIIIYEPTQRERNCYEEFEHFLRTL